LITSAQIRAARALLDWSRSDLAEKSGVGFSSMLRLESASGVPGAQFKTLEAIQKAFEKAGVEFIGTPEEGAGVRWKLKNT
jgi:transcriptional regulator with XRE-family HTH domain